MGGLGSRVGNWSWHLSVASGSPVSAAKYTFLNMTAMLGFTFVANVMWTLHVGPQAFIGLLHCPSDRMAALPI
jgi:hypothetical protein